MIRTPFSRFRISYTNRLAIADQCAKLACLRPEQCDLVSWKYVVSRKVLRKHIWLELHSSLRLSWWRHYRQRAVKGFELEDRSVGRDLWEEDSTELIYAIEQVEAILGISFRQRRAAAAALGNGAVRRKPYKPKVDLTRQGPLGHMLLSFRLSIN